MLRSLSLLAMLLSPLAPAFAQDVLGDLTFYDPDGKQSHVVPITSFYFALKPAAAAAADPDSDHMTTVTGVTRAPEPALLTWLTDPNSKRHVVLHIRDKDDAPGVATYDLAGSSLAGLSFGISEPGSGQQTLMVKAEHLTINGLAVY